MNELYDDGRTRGIDGHVDWARLEAEARKMRESGRELADRVEAASDITRIPDSRTPGRLASDRALHQLSRHYLIFVLAIIAILHFGIKFDINMYIASRKERHRKLAQSYCPHLDFIPRDDNSVQVSPLFYSPPGTLNWFCSRCGAVLPYEPNQEEVEAKATYYLNHPKAYKKAMKSFDKHAKKSL